MPGPVITICRLIPGPLAWLAMWLIVCASGALRADEVVPYDDALKKQRLIVEGILREGKIPGDKEQVFDDYITKHAIPQFVLRANANNFRGARDYFNNKVVKIATGSARQRLLELTVDGFNKILTDPALGKNFVGDDIGNWTVWTGAKVNVIAELGELTETPGGKPLAAALPILLEIAKPPTRGVRGRDDSLRVAAVVALAHHAENRAASAETRTKIRDLMLTILDRQKPPAGRDVKVNDYLRARAADVLALMKEAGPRNSVAVALDRITGNPAESARLRCQTAKAIGAIEFPTGANVDFKALADHIGHLVVDVCKIEIARAGNEPLDSNNRRRLKASVRDAFDGLYREAGHGALIAAATDPAQHDFVEKVAKRIKKIDDLLDKEADSSGMLATAKLQTPVNDLEGMLVPRAEVAPAEKPAEKPAEETEALAG